MTDTKSHDVVVLGSSFAGLGITHYLLRHIFPSLPEASAYKVTLVSPSAHFYFNIASPRMAVRSDLVPLEKLLLPLEDGFSDYPATSYQFIQAYARSLDPAAKEIQIEPVGEAAIATSLHYDTLIIATGASSKSPLWSPAAPRHEIEAALKEFQDQLAVAKSIVIAGGGPTGVEIAGELGFDLGKKKDIALYSGAKQLLNNVRSDVGKQAEKYLDEMGVTVINNIKVLSNGTDPDGKVDVHLSDGNKTTADLFIDARGSKPNTKFLPASWLNERGQVLVNQYQRVTGAKPGSGIYALGDVASYSHGGVWDVFDAVAPLAAVIEYDLSNGKSGVEVAYKRNAKENMIVPVGRRWSVGVVMGFWVPSFFGYYFKGKTFMVSGAKSYVMGDRWVKKKSL